MSVRGKIFGLQNSLIIVCLSEKVFSKDIAQVSHIHKGFKQRTRFTDAAGVYGWADIIKASVIS